MNRRLAALCTFALMGALTLACGSESATAPVVTSVAGTWRLTSVDGKGLPWVYSASDPKLELVTKQYVITSAGTFTTTYTLRGTELDGTVNTTTTNDAGTYTLANNAVTFVYNSDGSFVTGQATANTITIVGVVTQVFTKQ
jgi:hypothetical protein